MQYSIYNRDDTVSPLIKGPTLWIFKHQICIKIQCTFLFCRLVSQWGGHRDRPHHRVEIRTTRDPFLSSSLIQVTFWANSGPSALGLRLGIQARVGVGVGLRVEVDFPPAFGLDFFNPVLLIKGKATGKHKHSYLKSLTLAERRRRD